MNNVTITSSIASSGYACCTPHLGIAMRHLNSTKGIGRYLRVVQLDTREVHYECHCGKNATWYLKLMSVQRWEVLISRDGRRMLWKRYDTKEEARQAAAELKAQGKKVTVRQENPWTSR